MSPAKPKFNLKSEVEVFSAMQKHGKRPKRTIARNTGISPTAVQSILKRLERRKFYDNKAIPELSEFSEIPMAWIGFSDVVEEKLWRFKEKYKDNEFIRGIVHNNNELILFLMHETGDALTELIFELMEHFQARPILHIMAPVMPKLDLRIPDRVLDKAYKDLPDRRKNARR